MPFDSQGNFTRIHNWEDDRINNIEIITDHHDEEDDNFASGLSQTVLRNGASTMQNNFNMGNFQIKNLSDGTADTDAVTKSQLDTAIEDLEEDIDDFQDQLDDTLADVMQYNMITNCIVDAPNGVVECDGNTATVMTGLKVLIPDGFDDNGYLNNITFLVESDTDVSMINQANAYLFVRSDEACFVGTYLGAFESAPDIQNTNNYYYNYYENFMYTTTDGLAWTKTPCVIVARISGNGTNITSCVSDGVARVLVAHDKEIITNWQMPDYASGISRSANVEYTAEMDGYVLWQGLVTRSWNEYQLKIDDIVIGQGQNLDWTNNFARCIFPIARGSTYKSTGHNHFTYFPVKGF